MENVAVWRKIGNFTLNTLKTSLKNDVIHGTGLIHPFLHPFSSDHLPSIFKIKWCFSTSLWIGSKNNTMMLNTFFRHGISGILAISANQITAFLSRFYK